MTRKQPPNEAAIRDYLASNLDLIEPGLKLVEKEFELPNELGAKGFVDLLARDRFGHVVVIEIKKSDASARTALHELHKYVALLRNNHGLASDKVRCLVLSTAWHELLVPFSEYARSTDYHVEGREIILNNQFIPTALRTVKLAAESMASRICPRHMVYFFHDRGACESALSTIVSEFDQFSVQNYLAFLLQRDEQHEGYCLFALYLAVEAFSPAQQVDIEKHLSSANERLFDGEDWPHERTVISNVGLKFRPAETEIGYPEKFGQMLEKWTVISTARYGRFKTSAALKSDEDLCREVAGHEGDNAVIFQTICSPQYKPSWESVRSKSEYCLKGNPTWKKGLELFMKESETDETASLSIHVYNPLDFMMSLYCLVGSGDTGYLPTMQIVREDRNGQKLSLLLGYLAWDGKTCPNSPERVIKSIFGGVWEYFVCRNFGDTWQQEPRLLKTHGFRYAFCEFTFQSGKVIAQQEWLLKNGRAERRPLGEDGPDSVFRFVNANTPYIQGNRSPAQAVRAS
jgi:hypothetical protein